jgi:maltose/moltooligosaccharide transporter
MKSIQRDLTPAFYVLLGLPATAMGFALSVQIAALSWMLRTRYGLDIHEIGVVWAAGPIAGLIGQPLVGLISDKLWFWGGRRRPFILIGGLLAALCILALPYLGLIRQAVGLESVLPIAIAVALSLDLAVNISFNPTRSIIADVTPSGEARTKGFTWMQAVSNAFGAGAYLVSALLGNDLLIHFGVLVILLFSCLPLLFIEEPRHLDEGSGANQQDAAHGTQWGQLLKLYLAHAFSWLGIQTMFIYSFAFLEQRFAGDDPVRLGSQIGWLFFILNAAGSLWPILLLQPLCQRWGRVRTHVAALFCMAAGYGWIAFLLHDLNAMYAAFVLLSVGWAAVVSLPFAVMTESVDPSRMGFFMGLFNLSVVIPQLASSLLVGRWIEQASDKGVVYGFCTLCLVLSACFWLWVREPGRSRSAG